MNGRKTLWMGNIESWMDEGYLFSLLSRVQICPLRINIKQKDSKKGCCFLEFDSAKTAAQVLQHCNGLKVDSFTLKLNCVKANEKSYENKYTVFVGNIQKEATSDDLKSLFEYHFFSILSAKVIIDLTTLVSKGFGFVEFGDYGEYQKALQFSNKLVLNNKKLIINSAKKKKEDFDGYNLGQAQAYTQAQAQVQVRADMSASPTQQSDSPENSCSTTSLMSQNNIIFPQEASFLDHEVSPDNKPQKSLYGSHHTFPSLLQQGFKDIINLYQYHENKQTPSNQCNYYCNLYLLQNTLSSYGCYPGMKGPVYSSRATYK